MREIWILGATGRTGRDIAGRLVQRQLPTVLVGRDKQRLTALCDSLAGPARIEVCHSLEASIDRLSSAAPSVVVNTVGPFSRSAVPVVRNCPPGTHYLDLASDLLTFAQLFELSDQAIAADRCVVTGAGYGVVGTESVVRTLCQGRPVPERVRVDAIPMVDAEAGTPFGAALAATVVDIIATGGWRYERGRRVRSRLGGDVLELAVPDGSTVKTACFPSGDLEAARRASRAPFVLSASAEAPRTAAIRHAIPILGAAMRIPALRSLVERRLANTRVPNNTHRTKATWAHARVEWRDGSAADGWLCAGDSAAFTADVATEVAARLEGGHGRPGCFTPGELFGPEIAVVAGGQFVDCN